LQWDINVDYGREEIKADKLTMKMAKKWFDCYRCTSFHGKNHPKLGNLTIGMLKILVQHIVFAVNFREPIVVSAATTNIYK